MTGQGHNSADARLRSFIDRVLRLKEEQDALSADIREVYAEAKGEGYDKTAMGNVVAYLRKVEKKGEDAVGEAETMFSMYLDAYERASGTVVATHAHEENQNPVAKASEDNGATGEPEKVAADSVTGDASRLSVGSGTDTPNYQPTAIKPPPSDEDLEIPEFLRRDDGYARSAQ